MKGASATSGAMQKATPLIKKNKTLGTNLNWLKKDWQLYVLLLIPLFFVILFKYGAMYGLVISFKDYKIANRHPEKVSKYVADRAKILGALAL